MSASQPRWRCWRWFPSGCWLNQQFQQCYDIASQLETKCISYGGWFQHQTNLANTVIPCNTANWLVPRLLNLNFWCNSCLDSYVAVRCFAPSKAKIRIHILKLAVAHITQNILSQLRDSFYRGHNQKVGKHIYLVHWLKSCLDFILTLDGVFNSPMYGMIAHQYKDITIICAYPSEKVPLLASWMMWSCQVDFG